MEKKKFIFSKHVDDIPISVTRNMLLWKNRYSACWPFLRAVDASVVSQNASGFTGKHTQGVILIILVTNHNLFMLLFCLLTASWAAWGESVGAAVGQGIRSQVRKQLVLMSANFHDWWRSDFIKVRKGMDGEWWCPSLDVGDTWCGS